MDENKQALSRREFLKTSTLGVVAAAGAAVLLSGCATGAPAVPGNYTFTVISGATLTESDASTGRYKYKKHCKNCGWESSMATSVNGTSVSDEFKCPRCGYQQKVEIEVVNAGS